MTENSIASIAEPVTEKDVISGDKMRQLYETLLEYGNTLGAAPAPFFPAYEAACFVDLTPEDIVVPPALGRATESADVAIQRLTWLSKRLSGVLSLAPQAPTIGDQFLMATGAAVTCKLQKKGNIVVAFSGRHSLDQRSVKEALRFAFQHDLPIIYALEEGSEGGKVKTRAHSKKAASPVQRAEIHGVARIPVDGMDAIAAHRVAHEAIHHARTRGGPTLIECEIDSSKDPIRSLRRYLEK